MEVQQAQKQRPQQQPQQMGLEIIDKRFLVRNYFSGILSKGQGEQQGASVTEQINQQSNIEFSIFEMNTLQDSLRKISKEKFTSDFQNNINECRQTALFILHELLLDPTLLHQMQQQDQNKNQSVYPIKFLLLHAYSTLLIIEQIHNASGKLQMLKNKDSVCNPNSHLLTSQMYSLSQSCKFDKNSIHNLWAMLYYAISTTLKQNNQNFNQYNDDSIPMLAFIAEAAHEINLVDLLFSKEFLIDTENEQKAKANKNSRNQNHKKQTQNNEIGIISNVLFIPFENEMSFDVLSQWHDLSGSLQCIIQRACKQHSIAQQFLLQKNAQSQNQLNFYIIEEFNTIITTLFENLLMFLTAKANGKSKLSNAKHQFAKQVLVKFPKETEVQFVTFFNGLLCRTFGKTQKDIKHQNSTENNKNQNCSSNLCLTYEILMEACYQIIKIDPFSDYLFKDIIVACENMLGDRHRTVQMKTHEAGQLYIFYARVVSAKRASLPVILDVQKNYHQLIETMFKRVVESLGQRKNVQSRPRMMILSVRFLKNNHSSRNKLKAQQCIQQQQGGFQQKKLQQVSFEQEVQIERLNRVESALKGVLADHSERDEELKRGILMLIQKKASLMPFTFSQEFLGQVLDLIYEDKLPLQLKEEVIQTLSYLAIKYVSTQLTQQSASFQMFDLERQNGAGKYFFEALLEKLFVDSYRGLCASPTRVLQYSFLHNVVFGGAQPQTQKLNQNAEYIEAATLCIQGIAYNLQLNFDESLKLEHALKSMNKIQGTHSTVNQQINVQEGEQKYQKLVHKYTHEHFSHAILNMVYNPQNGLRRKEMILSYYYVAMEGFKQMLLNKQRLNAAVQKRFFDEETQRYPEKWGSCNRELEYLIGGGGIVVHRDTIDKIAELINEDEEFKEAVESLQRDWGTGERQKEQFARLCRKINTEENCSLLLRVLFFEGFCNHSMVFCLLEKMSSLLKQSFNKGQIFNSVHQVLVYVENGIKLLNSLVICYGQRLELNSLQLVFHVFSKLSEMLDFISPKSNSAGEQVQVQVQDQQDQEQISLSKQSLTDETQKYLLKSVVNILKLQKFLYSTQQHQFQAIFTNQKNAYQKTGTFEKIFKTICDILSRIEDCRWDLPSNHFLKFGVWLLAVFGQEQQLEHICFVLLAMSLNESSIAIIKETSSAFMLNYSIVLKQIYEVEATKVQLFAQQTQAQIQTQQNIMDIQTQQNMMACEGGESDFVRKIYSVAQLGRNFDMTKELLKQPLQGLPKDFQVQDLTVAKCNMLRITQAQLFQTSSVSDGAYITALQSEFIEMLINCLTKFKHCCGNANFADRDYLRVHALQLILLSYQNNNGRGVFGVKENEVMSRLSILCFDKRELIQRMMLSQMVNFYKRQNSCMKRDNQNQLQWNCAMSSLLWFFQVSEFSDIRNMATQSITRLNRQCLKVRMRVDNKNNKLMTSKLRQSSTSNTASAAVYNTENLEQNYKLYAQQLVSVLTMAMNNPALMQRRTDLATMFAMLTNMCSNMQKMEIDFFLYLKQKRLDNNNNNNNASFGYNYNLTQKDLDQCMTLNASLRVLAMLISELQKFYLPVECEQNKTVDLDLCKAPVTKMPKITVLEYFQQCGTDNDERAQRIKSYLTPYFAKDYLLNYDEDHYLKDRLDPLVADFERLRESEEFANLTNNAKQQKLMEHTELKQQNRRVAIKELYQEKFKLLLKFSKEIIGAHFSVDLKDMTGIRGGVQSPNKAEALQIKNVVRQALKEDCRKGRLFDFMIEKLDFDHQKMLQQNQNAPMQQVELQLQQQQNNGIQQFSTGANDLAEQGQQQAGQEQKGQVRVTREIESLQQARSNEKAQTDQTIAHGDKSQKEEQVGVLEEVKSGLSRQHKQKAQKKESSKNINPKEESNHETHGRQQRVMSRGQRNNQQQALKNKNPLPKQNQKDNKEASKSKSKSKDQKNQKQQGRPPFKNSSRVDTKVFESVGKVFESKEKNNFNKVKIPKKGLKTLRRHKK